MKRLLLLLVVLCTVVLVANAAPATNYGGNWSLDKSQSRNLPRYYERISAHQLDIKQDEAELSVGVTIESPERPSNRLEFKYRLDGTPTQSETMIRTPAGSQSVPTTLRAEPQKNGELAITIDREMKMPNGETFHGITSERWRLDASGKVLTIERADDTPMGRMETTMVFTRS